MTRDELYEQHVREFDATRAYRSKLADIDVAAIRAMPRELSGQRVADLYGISRSTVSRVRRGLR